MGSRKEKKDRTSNQPALISDPRSFLDRPFVRLEIGRLPTFPDIDFLRWLPTLKAETGLFLWRPTWYVVKASERCVPRWMMPNNSDTLVHAHYIIPDEEEEPSYIPSPGDYYCCSSVAKNFIASMYGITQFWSVNDPAARRGLKAVIEQEAYGREMPHKEYLDFLKSIHAEFTLHSWENLDNQTLRELLG